MKPHPKKLCSVALVFLFFAITNKAVAQTTIDCTNPFITYDMVAANAARSGATNPTLTSWGGVTRPFSWETNSTATINALASSVHGGVAGTNVFYGSTNNIPADLISDQIFNLYRGAITLTGRFFNLSTSTQYNEAFLSIIPSTYTNAVPVGQAGAAAVNTRIGISVGGSVNGANLSIYDNRSNATASTTIASAARPIAMTINTWYTLSTTFDIKDGNVVITDVSVNGTPVGFTYPVVIGSSYYPSQSGTQTLTWVNSLRTVASVDDLLDDFTITTNPCYNISGTVFDDANGLTDATVNGAAINNPAGNQLYAVLVDENESIAGTYATVAANGTYSFSNVPGGIFEVRLTNKVPGAANTGAPPSSLPAGWINTGENIGSSAGNDGSTNGTILVGTTGSANVNFGIQAYTASAYTFDCTTNAITFDMIPENAQISHSANQSSTGINNATVWSGVTNKFVWEAFGTDANLYGTASAIPQHAGLSGPTDNPTNVFYGGVWQNSNQYNTAAVSADFISKNTFSLSSTSGPITLTGRFLNRSGYTEENESYLSIVPDNYIHFQPVVRYDAPGLSGTPPTQQQREGIYVGGNITTGLFIVNNRDVSTVQAVPGSIAAGWGGLAPASETWYTLSATFDVQGTNLVVTNVSINGTTAAYTYPVIIGTVAAHSWISSLRAGASVDDLMDDFTIARNPCVYGTVFYDANGFTDGIVNGIGMDTAIGAIPLSVVLVDGLGNVVKKSPVAVDGTYSMPNVYPATYTMRLTTAPYAGITIGSPAPAAALAGDWINTGEFIGTGPGSDGTDDGNTATVVVAAGRNTGPTTLLNVNFGIQDPNGVLPVSLIDFRAIPENNIVSIEWITATETNNDYFVIEKSSDGANWQQLTIVKARGNSNGETYYQGEDNNPLTGKNYYRLKQVDVGGKFSYSKIVMVNRAQQANKNNLSVAPNPVISNSIQLSLPANETSRNSRICIYDINGRLKKEYTWFLTRGVNKITLNDVHTLPAGIYHISVNDFNGNTIGHSSFVK